MISSLLQAHIRIVSATILLAGAAFCAPRVAVAEPGRLAYLGVGAEGAIGAEHGEALAWARAHFDADYLSFDDLAATPDVLEGYAAAWWHEAESEGRLARAEVVEAAPALLSFMEAGGGLLLSGYATAYGVALGIESNGPDVVVREPAQSADWGLHQQAASPVFRGLPTTMALLSPGLGAENVVSWWSDPALFSGTWLADAEWQGGVVAMGEYRVGGGRCVVIGTGAFEWHFPGQVNGNRGNIERLSFNTLRLLGAKPGGGMLAYWALDEGGGMVAHEEVGPRETAIRNQFNRPEFPPGAGGTALRFDGFSTFVDVPGGIVNDPLDELDRKSVV